MTIDGRNIRKIRHALAQLAQARSYQRQATRLVREAEDALRAAVEAAHEPSRPPSTDGEKVAA
jgi:hypothetical protein